MAGIRLLLVTMCVGYFLVLLDVTVVNVALPQLGADLDLEGDRLAWVITGYSVPFAGLLLAAGATGDRIGHRRVVLAGLAVFGVASLGCALAPGAGWLLAARAVQGAGAALLLPGTLAVVAQAYPDDRARARAIGVWVAVGGLALPAGPVLAGVLVTAAGWRSVFWLNLPLSAAALLVAFRVLPRTGGNRNSRPDLLGAALAAMCLGLLVAGVSQRLWLLAAAAAPVAALFVFFARHRADAVLPLHLFGERRFALSILGAVAMNATAVGMLFLLTQLLQGVWRFDPLHSGLAILPGEVTLVLIPPLAGQLVARFGPAGIATIGLGISGAGIALLTVAGPTASYPALLPAIIIWAIGVAILAPALITATISAAPAPLAGRAAAVSNAARQSGTALGTATCAAIAGPVSSPAFLPGFHLAALLMAAICLVMAATYGLLTSRRLFG